LSAEKFALPDLLNKKERQLKQMEIRDTLDGFMQRFTGLLQKDSMQISCLSVLQFFEVGFEWRFARGIEPGTKIGGFATSTKAAQKYGNRLDYRPAFILNVYFLAQPPFSGLFSKISGKIIYCPAILFDKGNLDPKFLFFIKKLDHLVVFEGNRDQSF
jgi:hypothetical protein